MTPRNTSSGKVLEAMIAPALERGGYKYTKQNEIGTRPGGRKHIVDTVVSKDTNMFLCR